MAEQRCQVVVRDPLSATTNPVEMPMAHKHFITLAKAPLETHFNRVVATMPKKGRDLTVSEIGGRPKVVAILFKRIHFRRISVVRSLLMLPSMFVVITYQRLFI